MTRLRVTDHRTLSEPATLDLSAGLCVGDLRFTDRPQADQHATCQRCPVRAICPEPTPAPVAEVAGVERCPHHDRFNGKCPRCRHWLHTHDHTPEWEPAGEGRRRCTICHSRWRAQRVKEQRATWTEVLAALDTYQVGDRYMWDLIILELNTTQDALRRRLERRGMRGLAQSLGYPKRNRKVV